MYIYACVYSPVPENGNGEIKIKWKYVRNRPFRSSPVQLPFAARFFLNRRPLYGSNGGTFFDAYRNSSVRGYSDIGEYMSGNPCTTMDCQSNFGLQSGGQTRHGITGHHSGSRAQSMDRTYLRPQSTNLRTIHGLRCTIHGFRAQSMDCTYIRAQSKNSQIIHGLRCANN